MTRIDSVGRGKEHRMERTLDHCRFIMDKEYTLGYISLGPDYVFILEPPWKQNERNVSCVSSATYNLVREESSKYNCIVYALVNQPTTTRVETEKCLRYAILMHPANVVTELTGCQAPGMGARFEQGSPAAVMNSRRALRLIDEYVQENNINRIRTRSMY